MASGISIQQQMVSPLGDVSFSPPECQVGDDVLFYPTGSSADRPQLAKVYKAIRGSRGIELIMFEPGENRFCRQVHHLSDPMLQVNRVIQSKGAWAHTPKSEKERSLIARMDDLAERLNMVERFMESGETHTKKK